MGPFFLLKLLVICSSRRPLLAPSRLAPNNSGCAVVGAGRARAGRKVRAMCQTLLQTPPPRPSTHVCPCRCQAAAGRHRGRERRPGTGRIRQDRAAAGVERPRRRRRWAELTCGSGQLRGARSVTRHGLRARRWAADHRPGCLRCVMRRARGRRRGGGTLRARARPPGRPAAQGALLARALGPNYPRGSWLAAGWAPRGFWVASRIGFAAAWAWQLSPGRCRWRQLPGGCAATSCCGAPACGAWPACGHTPLRVRLARRARGRFEHALRGRSS
jgi:hypothetical protein